MNAETHFKVCPRCRRDAPLNAPQCEGCGRQFKTQFAPPTSEQTNVIPIPALRPQQLAPVPSPPVTGAAQDRPQQRPIKRYLAGIGIAMGAFLLYVFFFGPPGDAPPPPAGPIATGMSSMVRVGDSRDRMLMTLGYAGPKSITQINIDGAIYELFTWEYSDGRLIVAVRKPINVVERVVANGYERGESIPAVTADPPTAPR